MADAPPEKRRSLPANRTFLMEARKLSGPRSRRIRRSALTLRSWSVTARAGVIIGDHGLSAGRLLPEDASPACPLELHAGQPKIVSGSLLRSGPRYPYRAGRAGVLVRQVCACRPGRRASGYR